MQPRISSFFRFVFSCAAALALAGCAQDADPVFAGRPTGAIASPYAEPAPVVAAPIETGSWGEPVVEAVASREGPYLLDTGDRLRVFVYGQPNLSRAYTVDQEGQITVPLIGAVQTRGRTTKAVEDMIRQRLGAEYVRDPQVTVDVLQNRPFFIYGEVKLGGQYPFVSGMTVETAIAIAGGYSERASTRSFRVTRRINGFVDQIDAPGDYPVQPGDTVYVNERFF
jgi:polysaccharide export outer membrane protein